MSGAVRTRLADSAATDTAGQRLAAVLPEGGFAVALSGPLGAGKSTLARAVLRGLGVTGPVPSPSYSLVEPYECARGSVYHVDLYRVHGDAEVQALALDEALARGALLFVEWPEHGARGRIEFDLDLHLDYAGGGRELRARALTPAGRRVLAAWAPGRE